MVLILKQEIVPQPIQDLYIKRQKVLEILNNLGCNNDITRRIEMGIYNYSISKCNVRELIPLWECNEFNEIS